MNNFISKYGTFLVIPPVLLIIAIVAFSFSVTTKAEVILVQSAPNQITAYISPSESTPGTLHIDSPDFGHLNYPILLSIPEQSYTRLTCKGNLPPNNTLLKAYIITGHKPIYRILIDRL
ncbi:MAG: hypothetical protein NC453_17285 [Muribaculum sp.]|nr:hypothetical protein [Muribaculum sp.]